MKCYGMAAGIVLLIGFALGSLATLCGMIMIPGRYTLVIEEPWHALGIVRNSEMVKDELAPGDGLSSKEGSRGSEEKRTKHESDETELLVTWTGTPMKPNAPTRTPRSTRTSRN